MTLIAGRAVGICIIVIGVIMLSDKSAIRKMLDFWSDGKRMRAGGVINLIIGILFLSAASEAKNPVVINIIGVISLLKAAIIFILGVEKMKARLAWCKEKITLSLATGMALFAIFLGALILNSF